MGATLTVLRRTAVALLLLELGVAGSGARDALGQPAATVAAGPEALPAPEQLEAEGARIGSISIHVGDVFDLDKPGERKTVFRWANTLHRDTRARIVARQLLFAEGELYSASAIAESERALRALRFLAEVSVRPVAYHDGLVDIEVRTRDNWSLKPGLNFGRSGGVNKYKIEIEESNFLGWGKNLQLEHTSDVDRTSTLFSYEDPNLFGSRLRGRIVYADSSDGTTEELRLEQPFFALTTRRAGGFDLRDDRRTTDLYELGHVRESFEQKSRLGEVWFGLSRGLMHGETHRLILGVTYDEVQFAQLAEEPPTALPPDRTLVYPWVGWSWLQDRFVIEHDFDRVGRAEDLEMGWQGSARLGVAAESFGSDRDAVVYESTLSRGFTPGDRQLLLASATLGGRLEPGGTGPTLFSLGLRYLFRDFPSQALYVAASADLARHLDAESQLLLGGDTGLRGYPLRYQEGDRRALLTIEQRWYGEREFFHLFRLGAALFGDVGRAWFEGGTQPGGLGWLRDIGAGLRIAPTRTSHANTIRFDIAFPLDGDPSIEKVQYLVSTSERF
jgi:hypothetical protein